MSFEEKTITKKDIYQGKVISLEEHLVKLPNNKEAVREVVRHRGAVAVLCIKDGHVLLIRQYRKPLEEELLEIPAGKRELNESPEQTALRELEEETGYSAKKITELAEFYMSPGFSDQKIILFKAEDVFESNQLQLDDDEFVEKLWLPIDTAFQWMNHGRITDAKTLIALQYLFLDYNDSK